MTTILCVPHGDHYYMVADRQMTAGDFKIEAHPHVPKLWRLDGQNFLLNSPVIVGAAGDARACALLYQAIRTERCEQALGLHSAVLNQLYVVGEFLTDILHEHPEAGQADILLACENVAMWVSASGVCLPVNAFAIGSGRAYALGALAVMGANERQDNEAADLYNVMSIVSKYDSQTGSSFHIISTEDYLLHSLVPYGASDEIIDCDEWPVPQPAPTNTAVNTPIRFAFQQPKQL